jgi:hypothetical protein
MRQQERKNAKRWRLWNVLLKILFCKKFTQNERNLIKMTQVGAA